MPALDLRISRTLLRFLVQMFTLLAVSLPLWAKNTGSTLLTYLTRRNWYEDKRGARVAKRGIIHPEVEGVTHEMVEANGMQVHVARAGIDGAKPLLFLIHGFPEFWYSWRGQIEALQGEFEVAAVDLPGFNASSKPEKRTAYVTANISATLAAVVRSLGRSQCTVVGHDWGGAIAWDLAALYPELVQRLAVLAGPHPRLFQRNMDLPQLLQSTYIYSFQQPIIPEMTLRGNDYEFISHYLTSSVAGLQRRKCPEEDVELYKDAIAQPGALSSSLSYYRAVVVEDGVFKMNEAARQARREQLKMPVLVLWADRDVALGLNLLKRIGTVASRMAVHVIPNCSHWIQQDAADDVTHLLRLFANDSLPLLPTSRL